MDIALRFAYDGAAFPRGYARQPEGGTVEDALLAALREEGYVAGSWRTGSRTDKGVSALENVARCGVERPHLKGLLPALQAHLPDGVWVTGAAPVATDWNPRHHGLRTYLYIAPPRGERKPRMDKACRAFVGTHDLSAFARVDGGRDPERTIEAFAVAATGGTWLFQCASKGFLWNQVRRMVDAVLAVGRGEAKVKDIHASLRSGEPHPAFRLAPPDGLVLESVRYDPDPKWVEAAGPRPQRGADRLLARSLAQAAVARNVLGL